MGMINDYDVYEHPRGKPFRPLPDFGEEREDLLEEDPIEDDPGDEDDNPAVNVDEAPDNIEIIDEFISIKDDGTYSVDVEISFTGVEGADVYDVRVS